MLGGTLGTAAREGLSLAFPATGGVAWVIVLINVVGAFILGWLLDGLAARAHRRHSHTLRLLFATGALGGFTTYSSLAVGTAQLLESGRDLLALAHGVGTVLLGCLAAWLGLRVASHLRQRSATGRAS